MDLAPLIRTIPDFPKPGILFRDITTLFRDAKGFRYTVLAMAAQAQEFGRFDCVAGIEARGFILGASIAAELNTGFVPIRKKGKLPGETIGQSYELEYGTDEVEIHVGAVTEGDKVLLVDDLIATGGTAEAAYKLLSMAGADVPLASFVIDLPDLGGTKKLRALGLDVQTLVEFEGD